MWKYLKYFVPIILLILVVAGSFLFPFGDNLDIATPFRFKLVVGCTFLGAIWFLFQTKPSHKFSLFISGGLFLFILPILIIIFKLDFYFDEVVDKSAIVRISYFSSVQIGLGILYCLRFYYKDRQDIFSLLKLLLVLTTLILSIIIFSDAVAEHLIGNIGMTVILLIFLTSLLHIIDMIIWEKNRKKSSEETNPFDDLIDQISGNS